MVWSGEKVEKERWFPFTIIPPSHTGKQALLSHISFTDKGSEKAEKHLIIEKKKSFQ